MNYHSLVSISGKPMPTTEPTLTDEQETIEDYLVEQVEDGNTFFKSRSIKDALPYSASQIGVNLGILQDKTTRLDIETWAGDSDGTTWKITLAESEQHPPDQPSAESSTAAD